jgi:hypothetical protein
MFSPSAGNVGYQNRIADFQVGKRVRHKRLGDGVVTKVNLISNEIDVNFEKVGNMTLNLEFAPVKVVE